MVKQCLFYMVLALAVVACKDKDEKDTSSAAALSASSQQLGESLQLTTNAYNPVINYIALPGQSPQAYEKLYNFRLDSWSMVVFSSRIGASNCPSLRDGSFVIRYLLNGQDVPRSGVELPPGNYSLVLRTETPTPCYNVNIAFVANTFNPF